LGRRFQRANEITKEIEQVRRRGFAVGYNMKADGWGILAWPLTITKSPMRFGALAVGSPVPLLRRRQETTVVAVEKLLAVYNRELSIGSGSRPAPDTRRAR
jgi:hypothetical protein